MPSLAVALSTGALDVVHAPATFEEIGWTPIHLRLRLRAKRFGPSGALYQILAGGTFRFPGPGYFA